MPELIPHSSPKKVPVLAPFLILLHCDEPSLFLLPSFLVYHLKSDFDNNSVRVVEVSFGSIDPLSAAAVQCYEDALLKSQRLGSKVKAFMLCSPHNPLGTMQMTLSL